MRRSSGPMRLLAANDGGSGLEFALIAPILAAALFALFEVGQALHSGAAVRNAVQRSARELLVTPDLTGAAMLASVQSKLPDVPQDSLSLTVTSETLAGNVAARRVSWSYNYAVSAPFAPARAFVFDSSVVVPIPPGA